MRILFVGSAEISCVVLTSLMESRDHGVVGVVTPPDRPRGRRLAVEACPARRMAEAAGLPVLAPADINSDDSVAALRALSPDVLVVISYGQILKPPVLGLPRVAALNVHPSLLPRYRGAAPIPWALVNGETETGVSIMHLSPRMDAGDVAMQKRVRIGPEETAGDLQTRLAAEGGALLLEALDLLVAGKATRTRQDESLATYAPKLRKEDGKLDWIQGAQALYNRIRGFNPWPMCSCRLPGKGEAEPPPEGGVLLRVLRSAVVEGQAAPGVVVESKGAGPVVGTGTGLLRLTEVQVEGRKAMSGQAFLCGHPMAPGMRLG